MADFYLSTIDPQAHQLAGQFGFGLEIAEYCTAWNMDEYFAETDAQVRQKLGRCPKTVLHAPFNELFPCAIDPEARRLAARRYRQALALARRYGATKVIIHGGFHPRIYYPQWYTEQSVVFWKEFLREDPGVQIVLENVLEEQPELLLQIAEGVNNPHLRLCLDVGHVNAYSPVPVPEWLERLGPWLEHFHLHNNDGTWDTHSHLAQGTIAMEEFLWQALRLCPAASFTLELGDCAPSVQWLLKKTGGIL